MKNVNWKKVLRLVIEVLTVVASFVGGQASAQNGLVDLFSKYC